MEGSGGQLASGIAPGGGAAARDLLDDAPSMDARVAKDEAAADLARERYLVEPMAPIDADPRVAPLLDSGERVVAMRSPAVLDRRKPRAEPGAETGIVGHAYLTTRRLVFVGVVGLSISLGEIEEAILAGERLLLILRDGMGISLQVASPRLLRVEIATARAALRA